MGFTIIAIGICAFVAPPPGVGAGSPHPSVPSARSSPQERAPEALLTGKVVAMPISMVREFPFIEGEIAGIKGRFMLDTGMQDALVINDHRVPIAGGRWIGSGHFSSGQTYEVRLHDLVRDVRIGRVLHPRVTSVRSQDARMLERITPDFLGWVGFNYFSGHAMKLDYRRSLVTFYHGGANRFLDGEKLVATLPFETRRLPNVPLLRARVGNFDAIASLDTGVYGSLSIPHEKMQGLLRDGHLKRSRRAATFDLDHVRIGGRIVIAAKAIEVENEPSASAKAVGITEDTELELGYAFLRRYKTVWDFNGHRLHLLAR